GPDHDKPGLRPRAGRRLGVRPGYGRADEWRSGPEREGQTASRSCRLAAGRTRAVREIPHLPRCRARADLVRASVRPAEEARSHLCPRFDRRIGQKVRRAAVALLLLGWCWGNPRPALAQE